jgi:hypothetical protein
MLDKSKWTTGESYTPMKIQKSAKEAFRALETKKRDNGDSYQAFKSGSPEWMKNLAREAHGDMLPDDFRYEFIAEALEAISRYDDTDEARDSLEADIYTHGLTRWLHSRNDRTSYVDQAIQEFGVSSTDQALGLGQLLEKQEIFDLVVSFLENLDDTEESEAV